MRQKRKQTYLATLSVLTFWMGGCQVVRYNGTPRNSVFGESVFKSPEQSKSENIAQEKGLVQDGPQPSQVFLRTRTGPVPALTHAGGNIWRMSLESSQAFNILARIIAHDYILASSDRKNLVLNTDWDKFFVEGRLFRNRINVTVIPLSSRESELVIKNEVEFFGGNPAFVSDAARDQWFPSPDITDEVKRIAASVDRQVAFYLETGARTEEGNIFRE